MGEEDKAREALETFYIRSLKSMGLVMNFRIQRFEREKTTVKKPKSRLDQSNQKSSNLVDLLDGNPNGRNWLLGLGLIFLLLSLSLSFFFSHSL